MTCNEPPDMLIYDATTTAQQPPLLDDGGSVCVPDIVAIMGGFCPRRSSPCTKQPVVARKKRRQRTKSSKNKEEVESQRMTHIAVERNRRRQMNEHLSVLKTIMPDSYINRGDQASIVGGAIDYVKELEQLLQSLEAQRRTLDGIPVSGSGAPAFSQFFTYPQYRCFQGLQEWSPESGERAVADIEVTLVETHANVRVLTPRRPGQLLKVVAGLLAMQLTVLHLNVTSLDHLVLYSFSAKVEEGCNLNTVDDIAAAVHGLLSLIEAEALMAFNGKHVIH